MSGCQWSLGKVRGQGCAGGMYMYNNNVIYIIADIDIYIQYMCPGLFPEIIQYSGLVDEGTFLHAGSEVHKSLITPPPPSPPPSPSPSLIRI